MNDDFGARLGATLREQAPEQHPSLDFEAVAGDARRIRARRRGGLAAGAALTVALAVGVPYALTTTGGNEPAPVGPGLRAPVVTLEDDAPRSSSTYDSWITPAHDPLDLSGPWQELDADHTVSGPRPLPAQITRLGERALVVDTDFAGVDHAWLVGPDGDVEWQDVVRQDAVHSQDSVAVITEAGKLTVFDVDGRSRVFAEGLSATSRLVSVEADADCVGGADVVPCFAVVTDDGRDAPPRIIEADGATRSLDVLPATYTTDVGRLDLVTVRTPGPGEGKGAPDRDSAACTSLVLLAPFGDVTTQRAAEDEDQVLWTRCAAWTIAFAGDGATVVTAETASLRDTIGPSRVALTDERTGEVRTWIAAPDGGFIKDVLAYSTHMLQFSSYSYANQRWSLHSYDLETGEVEQIAAPVAGDDAASPFRPIQN